MPAEGVETMMPLYRLAREGFCEPLSTDVESVLGRPAISFDTYAEDYGE
jgi:hypothetical protein